MVGCGLFVAEDPPFSIPVSSPKGVHAAMATVIARRTPRTPKTRQKLMSETIAEGPSVHITVAE
jgi:hypothetical protein